MTSGYAAAAWRDFKPRFLDFIACSSLPHTFYTPVLTSPFHSALWFILFRRQEPFSRICHLYYYLYPYSFLRCGDPGQVRQLLSHRHGFQQGSTEQYSCV